MRVLVGIRGGVDSAYAARQLIDAGCEVEGAILVMHEHTDTDSAEAVAKSLQIKLHVIDARSLFDRIVKENFVSEYSKGRTPNPCIICNQEVKFKLLYEYAMSAGFDKIATGHYARIVVRQCQGQKRYSIARASDTRKDQSYMLYRLGQDILSSLIFPLSESTKQTVKREAADTGLVPEDRRESQEICFLPDGDYSAYVEDVLGKFPEGDFTDENGRVLGRHKGIVRYTVGQRKGLGISLGERAFVNKIDAENNRVVLSKFPSFTNKVNINNIMYSGMLPPDKEVIMSLLVKLRYLAPLISCEAHLYPDGRASLTLCECAKSVTSGQSAVLYYEDGSVAFGGIIDSSWLE